MQFLFRFDKPRRFQQQMSDDIYAALSKGGDILVNAPTGVGKTDASLSAALRFAEENGLSLFFLTPKISQHKIAVEALKGIREKFGMKLRYVDMVGKQNLCTNMNVNGIGREAFYSACEKAVKANRCPMYSKFKEMAKSDIPADLESSCYEGHNALFAASFSNRVCAYELSSHLAKSAKVVIADYAHMLNPYTRSVFMKRIGHTLADSIIVWDEAHNIMSAASSYFSRSIGASTVDAAIGELASIGSSIDLSYLKFAIRKLGERKALTGGESFLAKGDMPHEVLDGIEAIIGELEKAGLEYLENSKAKRSSILSVSRFLSLWGEEDDSTARILSKMGNSVRISLSCLYPEKALEVFDSAYANVFMSATLLPLEMHAELLGVNGAETRSYGSPFPKANKIAFIDGSVTTKYDRRSPETYKMIASRISGIKSSIPGNVAVFFPGFEVLNSVYRHMKSGSIFIQRHGMHNMAVEQMLHEFKRSDDSLLFGVMGGSLSEGVDYADNVIKGVVIVGVPLTKPNLETRARIAYLDKRFNGRGSEYAYITPAVVRAIQAAGRAIRSERDRAVIVFMDSRYRWGTYSSLIRNTMEVIDSGDYISRISDFWSRERNVQSSIGR